MVNIETKQEWVGFVLEALLPSVVSSIVLLAAVLRHFKLINANLFYNKKYNEKVQNKKLMIFIWVVHGWLEVLFSFYPTVSSSNLTYCFFFK